MRVTQGMIFMLAVMLCVGVGAGADSSAPAPQVAVGRVDEAQEIVVKRYTGNVATKSSVDLLARVPGELLRIGFEEGDTVEEGQILYELERISYEAEVKNAEAGIAELEAKLVYVELSLNRAEGLYGQSAGTKEDFDRAASEYEAAKAGLLAADARYITAKDNLDKTTIRAPIRGKIGRTNYTVGNYLTPESGIIATINQLDPLRVTFAIANKDFLEMFGSEETLKKDASIQIRLADGSLYDHEGRVAFLDNQASRKTDAIRIYSEVLNPVGRLIPGSTVTVFLTAKNGGVLSPVVLPSAVMHDSESAYVYVVDGDNVVSRRDVVLGYSGLDVQFVHSGLSVGEVVVEDGMHKVVPGGVVVPVFRGGDVVSLNRASQ